VSQSQQPRYILDASVATKWFLNDEEHADEAHAVLLGFREDRIALLAPDHIRYEVASALRTAVRMNRISDIDSLAALNQFIDWNVPTLGSDALLIHGHQAALRYGCALYDGLYLALAELAECSLVYADRRLRNTLGGSFARAIWIEDFR
jgi:predicted nucleic acid-binding protein